ncbi:unnamed protein product [Fraxinus pennsylvanica]|uniref:Uncharacterized protein n=1 Tax=Fraxinus pennsylvanica TaxID=56036 RepID=A0AAD1ZES5_9LAMI|nr:unnamed protein product [Fraxinus pennsylvanica]
MVLDVLGRIALERRRFLKNAKIAVQRQAMWSNLAHEMMAEFRSLSAEEFLPSKCQQSGKKMERMESHFAAWEKQQKEIEQTKYLMKLESMYEKAVEMECGCGCGSCLGQSQGVPRTDSDT